MMRRATILLVDDDREMCEELVAILGEQGYGLDLAYDGKEAIALMERRVYDLLMLDLKMPGINGYEVLKYVRRMHPGIRILVVSGSPLHGENFYAENQVFLTGENSARQVVLEADGFIGKPFDVEDILRKIEAILGRSGEQC